MYIGAAVVILPNGEIADVVLPHRRDRLGLQHLVAVAAALVEDHLGELDVVAGSRVEAAAAHVEFRLLLELERDRRELIRPRREHAWRPGACACCR